jgi:hypothetical protein
VFLAGTSAGGGGATFQYRAVRDTFATTVHSVIDSTPGFPNPADADKWTLWGVTPPCPTCTTFPAVRAYNRSLDPASRYGFLSFAFDPTTADGRTVDEFTALLDELRATLAADPNARSFVADNLRLRLPHGVVPCDHDQEPPRLPARRLPGVAARDGQRHRLGRHHLHAVTVTP